MANQLSVFQALDAEMVRLFHDGSSEALDKSDYIARKLLEYAELPLGLRCRACIVLAGFDEPGYVGWAEEAARVADLALAQTNTPTEAELALHQRAHDCLKEAQEWHEEHKEEMSEVPDEEDGATKLEFVRAVSSSTATAGPDGIVNTVVHLPAAPNAPTAVRAKKSGAVRVDSANGTAEQQDVATGKWFPVDVVFK